MQKVIKKFYVFVLLLVASIIAISCITIDSKSAHAYSTNKHATIYPSSYFPMAKITYIASSDEYMTYINNEGDDIQILAQKKGSDTYIQKKFSKTTLAVGSEESIYYYVVNKTLIMAVSKQKTKIPTFYSLALEGDSQIPTRKVGMDIENKQKDMNTNIVSTGTRLVITDYDKNVQKYDENLNLVNKIRLENNLSADGFAFVGENKYYSLSREGRPNINDLQGFTPDIADSEPHELSEDQVKSYQFFENLRFGNYLFLRHENGKTFKLFNIETKKFTDLKLGADVFDSDFKIENKKMTIFDNQIKILDKNEVVSYNFDANNGAMTRAGSLSNAPGADSIQSFDHLVYSKNNFYVADNKSKKIYKVSLNSLGEKEELVNVGENIAHIHHNGASIDYSTKNKVFSYNWISQKHEEVLDLKTETIISFAIINGYKYVLTTNGLLKYNENNKKEDIVTGSQYKRMTSVKGGTKLYLLREGYVDIVDTTIEVMKKPIIKKVGIGTLDASKQVSMKTDSIGNIYLIEKNGKVTKIKDTSYTISTSNYDVKGTTVGSDPEFTDIAISDDTVYLATKNYLAKYTDTENKINIADSSIPNAIVDNQIKSDMAYDKIKFYSLKESKEFWVYKLNNSNEDIVRVEKSDIIMTFGVFAEGYTYGVLNGEQVRYKDEHNALQEIETTYFPKNKKMQIKANYLGKTYHTDTVGTKELFSGAVVECILTCKGLNNLCYVKYKNDYVFVEESNLTPIIDYKDSQTKGKGVIQSKEIGKRIPLYSEASTSSEIKTMLVDGTKYKLIEEENEFYKVLITENGKNKTRTYGYVLKSNTIKKGLTHTQTLIIIVSILSVVGITILILTTIASKKRY